MNPKTQIIAEAIKNAYNNHNEEDDKEALDVAKLIFSHGKPNFKIIHELKKHDIHLTSTRVVYRGTDTIYTGLRYKDRVFLIED